MQCRVLVHICVCVCFPVRVPVQVRSGSCSCSSPSLSLLLFPLSISLLLYFSPLFVPFFLLLCISSSVSPLYLWSSVSPHWKWDSYCRQWAGLKWDNVRQWKSRPIGQRDSLTIGQPDSWAAWQLGSLTVGQWDSWAVKQWNVSHWSSLDNNGASSKAVGLKRKWGYPMTQSLSLLPLQKEWFSTGTMHQ